MKKKKKNSSFDLTDKLDDKYISCTTSASPETSAISAMEQLNVAAHAGLMEYAQVKLEENERDYRIHQRANIRRNNIR